MIEAFSIIKRDNITLHYVGLDRVIAGHTMEVLHNSYNTLAEYHGLQNKKILVRVIIVPNRRDYDKILSSVIGSSKAVPTKNSEVFRVHINDILLLSTFAYGEESSVQYTRESYYKSLIECMNKVFENFLAI